MPVDKQVWERYKILDSCFRKTTGLTYREILDELEDHGIFIELRTLKQDKKVFQDEYGAVFMDGLKNGREVLIRYEDVETPVLYAKLSEAERGKIGDILCKLQIHNDIPHYQWMILLLEILMKPDNKDDFGKYVEFENNLELEGMESFRGLMEACIERYSISFNYSKFSDLESTVRVTTSPYLLKQYNKRWFLVCRNYGFSSMSTYAIDRIVPDSLARERDMDYVEPDWQYIDHCLVSSIGLTGAFDQKQHEDVKLRVSKSRYPYLRTKPIVPWQEEIFGENTDNSVCLLLKDMNINKELKALILSYLPDVEVLEPSSLRNDIRELLKASLDKYR